jgi:hypothetical protein
MIGYLVSFPSCSFFVFLFLSGHGVGSMGYSTRYLGEELSISIRYTSYCLPRAASRYYFMSEEITDTLFTLHLQASIGKFSSYWNACPEGGGKVQPRGNVFRGLILAPLGHLSKLRSKFRL